MSTELDTLIHEKRLQLKDALAVQERAREAVAQARTRLSRLDANAEIERLESEERAAATQFNTISEELAQLHRRKFGEWHITWRGPRPYR